MDNESLEESIKTYECQLVQVKLAISASEDGKDKNDLVSLKNDLEQLIELTKENLKQVVAASNASASSSENTNSLDNEFAMFMSEMEKVGAVQTKEMDSRESDIERELKELEGMKCRAPHRHQWGDTMYHNALICSVITSDNCESINDIEVKVMFINPTHEEMLPCPYLLESSCKFDDEKCKYSHGEIVAFSTLQEYTEPKFEELSVGSKVLAKQSNRLWHRAVIKRMFKEKCLVKFDFSRKDREVELHEVLPLGNSNDDNSSDEESPDQKEERREEIINMSLLNTPSSQALGDWEKHTKGIGSKLMQKMGYVIGTGLGKDSDGRLDPVTAVVLPPGKSLDHCMNLREKAGGDKDLFSVERKLKKLQKKQEIQNQKAYEREKKKVDVFNFLNKTLATTDIEQELRIKKTKHRNDIKGESSRNLNIAQMKIEEEIKRVERDMFKIRDSLKRHSDVRTQMNKNLRTKLESRQFELKDLKAQAVNIAHEQSMRNDKKKLTIF